MSRMLHHTPVVPSAKRISWPESGRVADRELELGEREHDRRRTTPRPWCGSRAFQAGTATVMKAANSIAAWNSWPHMRIAVEDGLAAPERAAAEAPHQGRLEIAGHAAARWRPAGAVAKGEGPEEAGPGTGAGDSNRQPRRYDRRP